MMPDWRFGDLWWEDRFHVLCPQAQRLQFSHILLNQVFCKGGSSYWDLNRLTSTITVKSYNVCYYEPKLLVTISLYKCPSGVGTHWYLALPHVKIDGFLKAYHCLVFNESCLFVKRYPYHRYFHRCACGCAGKWVVLKQDCIVARVDHYGQSATCHKVWGLPTPEDVTPVA